MAGTVAALLSGLVRGGLARLIRAGGHPFCRNGHFRLTPAGALLGHANCLGDLSHRCAQIVAFHCQSQMKETSEFEKSSRGSRQVVHDAAALGDETTRRAEWIWRRPPL